MTRDACEIGTCAHIACRPSDDDSTPWQRGEAVCLATVYGPDPQDCGDPATGASAGTPLCARHLDAWQWAAAHQDDDEETA